MNKHDKEILSLNWELKKEQLKEIPYQETMDISSSCYVTFGTCGVGIYKYRNGGWNRKTVNGWKNLSFNEFMERFDAEEWEAV